MSRAFVKEDVEVPERSHRRRGTSGLPPGALNYMTERGGRRLREQVTRLRRAGKAEAAAEVERVLASATIVVPPVPPLTIVTFGATVTVRAADGSTGTYRIVGVDEIGFEEDSVSWISPQGRALLGAERGQKLTLGDGGEAVTVLKFEHQ